MLLGLLCALGSAVCFGTASVFQAIAAQRTAGPANGAGGVDARSVARAVRQGWYVVGLAMDTAGFVLEIIALRRVPVYTVGAALASSLAVTAVVASRVMRVALGRVEWSAVAVVCLGLGLLAVASGSQGHSGSDALRWGVLGATGVVLGAGLAAGRLPARARSAALGLASGLGFGAVAVAVRLIPTLSPGALVANPAAYAVPLGGGAAFLLLTAALGRGSVTVATAAMVIGETVGPAVVGVLALGDRTRHGLAAVAVTGYALALLGALALARFGEGGAPVGPEASGAPEAAESSAPDGSPRPPEGPSGGASGITPLRR